MNILKRNKYFYEKARIDKRNNQKTAYKVQMYANNVVDKYIFDYNQGVKKRPMEETIFADLAILNKPAVYSNYQRLLNSPYFDEGALDKFVIKHRADKNLEHITELELQRMVKNLDFVEENLKTLGIPVDEYNRLILKQPYPEVANRGKIIKEIQKRKLEASEIYGVNIPDYTFTYRNIDVLAESLLRQSQMTSSYEKAILANEAAKARGEPPIYTKKKWIWTGRGKTTRHESNNMQERDIDEYFVIINDKTLDIDTLMYPCDPNGKLSNTYICYCECEYYGDGGDYLGGIRGLTPKNITQLPRTVTFARSTSSKQIEYEGRVFVKENQSPGDYTKETASDYEIEREQILGQRNIDVTSDEKDVADMWGTWDCQFISAIDRHSNNLKEYFAGIIRDYYIEMTGVFDLTKKELEFEIGLNIGEFTLKHDVLHRLISKMPGLYHNTVLYRGGRLSSDLKNGDEGIFEGFTSTSFLKSPALDFQEDKYLITILAPKGTKGLCMNDRNITLHANFQSELHEYVLDANQKYKVVDIDHKNKIATVLLI